MEVRVCTNPLVQPELKLSGRVSRWRVLSWALSKLSTYPHLFRQSQASFLATL